MAKGMDFERVTVHIPRGQVRRFKAVFRALGLEIEEKNAIDRALDDVMAGRVQTYSSVAELMSEFA